MLSKAEGKVKDEMREVSSIPLISFRIQINRAGGSTLATDLILASAIFRMRQYTNPSQKAEMTYIRVITTINLTYPYP
jgi:hypothetical protein